MQSGQWGESKNGDDLERVYKIEKVPIIIEGRSYIGFVFYFNTSYYDYPKIHVGFHIVPRNVMFTIDPRELQKLKFDDINKVESKVIQLKPFCTSKCNVGDLNYELKRTYSPKFNLFLNILPIKHKNIVRFTAVLSENVLTTELFRTVTKSFDSGAKKMLSPDTFKEKYYEVEFDSFNKIFQIDKI